MNALVTDANNFASLSLKDLLYARHLFHYHLLSKKNVTATAVGPYRIRVSDPWPTDGDEHPIAKRKSKRTLFNSEIRPYSWPSVYVFVNNWDDEETLAASNPVDVVPKTLYMPDGKSVPVCVIETQKQSYDATQEIIPQTLFPRNVYMPGTPLINRDAQGLPRLSTAGAIVKDGEKFYVLTCKHAIGETGSVIEAVKGNTNLRVGITGTKFITRKKLSEVYPNFPSSNQYLHMDVGLVEIDDITQWKTEVISVGEVESVLDLYDNNLSLKLVGLPVVGFGAVSGQMVGEIHGLFYRYKAQGGYEYLSDFLIGPRTVKAQSKNSENAEDLEKDNKHNIGFTARHGDSGTVLLIQQEQQNESGKSKSKFCYYPFAMLWGKHEFIESGIKKVQPFALATSLSVALENLELDFVRDLNIDNDLVWGYIGHFAIGSKLGSTVNLLGSSKLKKFIEKNKALLSMSDEDIKNAVPSPRVIRKGTNGNYDANHPYFVPLADVPDNVWKSNVNVYNVQQEDGTTRKKAGPGSRGQLDNPNHFADIDLPRDSDGKTLLELSLESDFSYLTPINWLSFYEEVAPKYKSWAELYDKPGTPFSPKKHWGALPFRVQQLANAMIDAASNGSAIEFLCAGGVLIHYIGDACQPLHSSYMSQGDPDHPVSRIITRGPNSGNEVKVMRGEKVHSGYEDDMVTSHSSEIMDSLEQEIEKQEGLENEKIIQINSGFDAAKAVLLLIKATQDTLPPATIIDKWVSVQSLSGAKARNDEMWEAFKEQTIEVMARGCRVLAKIWDGAWKVGHGDANIGSSEVLKEKDIRKLYDKASFIPSVSLDNMSFDI